MVNEFLPVIQLARVEAVRKLHLVVDRRYVLCRHTDLDDLDVLRCVQHAMPDLRRLDQAVAAVQAERSALVLVDNVDPPPVAEDELETDGVVVDHVGNRPTVRYADVAGDD